MLVLYVVGGYKLFSFKKKELYNIYCFYGM